MSRQSRVRIKTLTRRVILNDGKILIGSNTMKGIHR